MTCPAGEFANSVIGGSTSATDGCTACGVGTYSLGGSATSCTAMNCPAGKIATASSATNATYGCVECDQTWYSYGGAATMCYDSDCPAGEYAALVAGGATTP
jgi:hypothetical protein